MIFSNRFNFAVGVLLEFMFNFFVHLTAKLLSCDSQRTMKILVAVVLFITGASADAVECSKNNPEKFSVFLDQFSTDQRFAVRRTLFPLRILRWEYGLNPEGKDDSAPIKSSVLKPEYLQWQVLASYMASNGMTSAVDSQTQSSAVLRVGKPYTDWTMLYHFRSRKGCWFFWKYENQSL